MWHHRGVGDGPSQEVTQRGIWPKWSVAEVTTDCFYFPRSGLFYLDIFPTVFLLRVATEPISTWTYRVPLDQRSTRCLFRSTSRMRFARFPSSRSSTRFYLTLLDILPRAVYTILHSAHTNEHKCMSFNKIEYQWRVADTFSLLLSCATCSQNSIQCPGHFGHIELPVPTYNPMFFDNLYAIIRAKCVYCNKFRVNRYFVRWLTLSLGWWISMADLWYA